MKVRGLGGLAIELGIMDGLAGLRDISRKRMGGVKNNKYYREGEQGV